jgi:hypothetical protein
MFDVIDGGCKRPFLDVNHSLGDLVRGQSGETPDHAHHRDFDGGKNVRRRLQQDKRSYQ